MEKLVNRLIDKSEFYVFLIVVSIVPNMLFGGIFLNQDLVVIGFVIDLVILSLLGITEVIESIEDFFLCIIPIGFINFLSLGLGLIINELLLCEYI